MAEQEFHSAYLIVGADELKREFVVKRLNDRMRQLGDLDFNKDTFTGSSVDVDTLIGACNTLPFMSEKRMVLVEEAEKMRKPVQEAVISYLANPSETTVLALVADKLAKNTRLYKAIAKIGKQAVVDCAPRSARELPGQVRKFAASEGVSITMPAAEELISLVGDSTVHLAGEIKKMAVALGKGATIDVEQVHTYVARVAEPKPWFVSDALAARDARKVATLLARMGKQSPFGLLTMCVNRIRDLLIAKEMRNSGQRELEQALVSAAECERAMKSGSDQEGAFERWALEVCTRA